MQADAARNSCKREVQNCKRTSRMFGPSNQRCYVLATCLLTLPLTLYSVAQDANGAPNDKAIATPGDNVRIADVEHLVVCYDREHYCSHPREVLFKSFDNGELIIGHYHAPCAYREPKDVYHYPMQARSVLLMQRSTDGGRTWPSENNVVLFDQRMTPKKKQTYFSQLPSTVDLDMFSPESVFFFGRTFFPPKHTDIPVCFALRSPYKGRNWEKTPIVIEHPAGKDVWLHRHAPPVIRMPDGRTLLAAFQASDRNKCGLRGADPAIFASKNQGRTWQFLSRPIVGYDGSGRFTYTALLLLPDGLLHCYTLHIDPDSEEVNGIRNAICLSVSRDGGKHWDPPKPITYGQAACWSRLSEMEAPEGALPEGDTGRVYRSPWPVLLRDGRILVTFARRRAPYSIGGIVSADGGKTWSEEFAIRSDSAGPDMGYPVAAELHDGSIFVAYYMQANDGNGLGGTRYMAATRFRFADGAVGIAP